MTLDERMEKLERELAHANRRNRWLLVVLGLCLGSWVVGGACATTASRAAPAVVEAQEFRLVDATGETRAKLGLSKDLPRLDMYDENDKVRVVLAVGTGGPGILLADRSGELRLILSVDGNGPRLGLADEKGTKRVMLEVERGKPAVVLHDESGRLIWRTP